VTTSLKQSEINCVPDFRCLFESSPGLYLVLLPDENFTIVAVSDAYARATMTTREKIAGRPLFEVFPDNPDDPHATGVANLRASLGRVVHNKVPDTMAVQKYDIRRPESEGGGFEERYWSPINSPVLREDGKLSYIIHRVEDVTEFVNLKRKGIEQSALADRLRTEAERMESEIFLRGQELQQTNEKLRLNQDFVSCLIESINDYAIFRLDTTGRVVSWNEGAKRIKGYEAGEIIGENFSKFYTPDAIAAGKPQHTLEIATRDGRFEEEGWRLKKNGARFWANVIVRPLFDANGGLTGYSKVTRDITERKESEDRQQQFLEKLKELDRLKTQFFSNVSHELRTPLSLIIGPAGRVMKEATLSGKSARDLDTILRNARTLLRHVNDLLDISKLDEKRLTPAYSESDLAQTIRSVAGNFDGIARDRNIDFKIETAKPLIAQFDIGMIQRVLLNLLSNAFRFTPDGGRIEIRTDQWNGVVTIEVDDSGPGVPEQFRKVIFERFRQVDGGATRRQGGTGLGLAIAKEFIELHGGQIEVEAAPAGGALFRIVLPLRAPPGTPLKRENELGLPNDHFLSAIGDLHAPGRLPCARTAPAKPAALGSRHKVLVVEDSPDLNRFLVELLGGHYDVESACDGEDGLAKARAFKPDLILTDIMMPKLSGDELLKEVRKDPALQNTLVILLTAKADDLLKLQLLAEGAQDYIVKPFIAEEVVARVENLLSVRRSQELGRIDAVLENALDCVIGADARGLITSWNIQAEKTFGWSRQEAIGRELAETILPPESRPAFTKGLERFGLTGQGPAINHRNEFFAIKKDGSRVPVEVSVTPIPSNRGPLFYGFVRDISERNRFIEELRSAKDQAEAANYAKSAFLANMSHEIRTPLAVILGFSDLLASAKTGAAEKDGFIKIIKRNGELLSTIISDILDFSKIEAGKLDVEYRDIQLSDLLSDIKSVLQIAAGQKGIELKITTAPNVPTFVRTDPQRLKQILLNVGSNAIKFTKQGEVALNVNLIRDENGLPLLAFTVVDTGVGLSEVEMKDLFRPFSQADQSTTRLFGGAGLGLAISRRLAKLLGGDVVLEKSVKGKGSTFTVTIAPGPIARGRIETPAAEPATALAPAPEAKRLDGLHVLIAEDSYENQFLVSRILEMAGAHVDLADDGRMALEKVHHHEYDALVIDLQMPVMDGVEAVMKLRSEGFSKPILALTAHAMREQRELSLKSGFNDHISKPVDPEFLVRRIAECCHLY